MSDDIKEGEVLNIPASQDASQDDDDSDAGIISVEDNFAVLMQMAAQSLDRSFGKKLRQLEKNAESKGSELSKKLDAELAEAQRKVGQIDALIEEQVKGVRQVFQEFKDDTVKFQAIILNRLQMIDEELGFCEPEPVEAKSQESSESGEQQEGEVLEVTDTITTHTKKVVESSRISSLESSMNKLNGYFTVVRDVLSAFGVATERLSEIESKPRENSCGEAQ